jgi:O-antigen/teichoic acid export membrane protein
MDNLREKVVRGGVAKVSSQAASLVLRVGSLMILARILDPKDFGLVAMVTAISGVFALFKEAGLSTVTIQRATITAEQSSTLFWVNMLVGAILAALMVASAPFLVSFYHEGRLFWIAVVLATDFLFAAAATQHSALLRRQMRFVSVSLIEFASLAAGVAVGVGMAMQGLGYWALVGMTVVQPAVSTVCLWGVTRWIPGPPRRGVGLGAMLRFGGLVTLNSLVVYVAYNLEKVLLGRFWGVQALGLYGRAYQLISIPTDSFNASIGGVALSALSRVQNDARRLRECFLKGYSLLLTITVIVTTGWLVFADDLILVVLGPKWSDTVAISRLLAPTILVFALINPAAWLLFALGYVGRSLKIALVIAPLMITAYLLGLPYGPTGVAFAYSAVMTLWVVPHVIWCTHGTPVSAVDMFRVAVRPLVSAALAAAAAIAVRSEVSALPNALVRLASGGGVLVIVYFATLLFVFGQKTLYADVLRGLTLRRSDASQEAAVASAR